MSRLPTPGGDDDNWGDILNDFLAASHNADGTIKDTGVIADKATDNSVVHDTGNETVAGIKTFSDSPVVPTPSTGNQATNKTYVDSVATATPDATASTKGKLQLAGDLGGTAASPTVPGLAGKVDTSRTVNGHALSANVSVTKGDVGLANVDNTSDASKPVSGATQTAIDAKQDSLGYTAENAANKDTDVTLAANSDTKYPSQKAAKTYVDNQVSSASTPDATASAKGKLQLAGDLGGTAASPTVPGLAGKVDTTRTVNGHALSANITVTKSDVGLANVDNTSDASKPVSSAAQTAIDAKVADAIADSVTSVAPSQNAVFDALALKQNSLGYTAENTANKDTDGTLAANSDTKYVSQKATKTYVDTQVSAVSTPDATASTKGKIQLAGDLGGTAASPAIAAGAIDNSKISASAAIAESKLSLASDAAIGTASRRTLGYGATQAAPGSGVDSRLNLVESGQTNEKNARVAGDSIDNEWRAGRVWATNFSNSTRDAAMFDVTNFTYTTDGGATVVQQNNAANISTFLLKSQFDVPNSEVVLYYKIATRSPYTLGNQIIRTVCRWLDNNNRMGAWDDYSGHLQGQSYVASTDVFTSSFGGITNPINQTDTSTYRILKCRVVDDVVMVKNWFVGSDEPAWQIVEHSRPPWPMFGTGNTISTDNQEHGPAGFAVQFTGASFSELSITELVRDGSNYVRNVRARDVVGSTGRPAYWNQNQAPAGGESIDIINTADRYGMTRPAFRIVSTGANQLGWEQYSFLRAGSLNPPFSRVYLHPRVEKPGRDAFVSVWSKGTGITNPSPSVVNLGAGIVTYYYDAGLNALQGTITPADYYTTLGPNAGGVGTWDWYETLYRVTIGNGIAGNAKVAWWRWGIYLHDAGSTGTLLFNDLRVTS